MRIQSGNVRTPPNQVFTTSGEDVGQTRQVERLVVEFTQEERNIIQAHRDAVKNITVVGQVVGRSPALRDLNAWAKETLHTTLEGIVHLGNGYFEATFSSEAGSAHVLDGKYYMGGQEVILAHWSPLFSLEHAESTAALTYPIWVQI